MQLGRARLQIVILQFSLCKYFNILGQTDDFNAIYGLFFTILRWIEQDTCNIIRSFLPPTIVFFQLKVRVDMIIMDCSINSGKVEKFLQIHVYVRLDRTSCKARVHHFHRNLQFSVITDM